MTLREFILAGSSLATGNTIRDHLNNQSSGGNSVDRTFTGKYKSNVSSKVKSSIVSSIINSNVSNVLHTSKINPKVTSKVSK